MKRSLLFSGFFAAVTVAAGAQAAPATVPMGENERAVHVVGTPFTQPNYQDLLETHLLLRHAQRGMIFRRVAVVREHLESFAAHADESILVHKPTLVVFQAGFDDLLTRAQSAYAPKLNFGWYPKGLEAIVTKLRAANVKLVVCSVTPWDNGSTKDRLLFPMDGLKGMVDAAREISARHRVVFADIFTEAIGWPMSGNNVQSKYYYGPREHERSWQLLLSQVNFDFSGSMTEIDAKVPHAETRGAKVEGLKTEGGRLTFTLQNAAGVGPAVLKMIGLAPGQYSVVVGDKKVATRSADELAAGIDLGAQLKTKAGTKEFAEELTRGHAAVAALPEIQDYRLPGWAKLPDFEQQKAAALQRALSAISEHDAAARRMVTPEPLAIRIEPAK